MTETELIEAFEQAGRTLLALPGGHIGPRLAQPRYDTVRELAAAYGWSGVKIRPAVPSAAEITAMDETFALAQLVGNPTRRRVVQARSLVHPIDGRHLASWRRLASLLGADYRAVQRWHRDAIVEIVTALRNRDV